MLQRFLWISEDYLEEVEVINLRCNLSNYLCRKQQQFVFVALICGLFLLGVFGQYLLKPSNTVSRRARGDSWADARSDAFFPEFGSGGGNSNRGTYSPPDGRLFIEARGQGRDEMLLETI